MAYSKKNLANSTLSAGIASGATSLTVQSGDGTNFPAVPFYATITPYGVLSSLANSEIVKVTAISTDTLTIVRGQRGTTAAAFVTGDIVSNGVYIEDLSPTDVTCTTARTTAAKVGTTTGGDYVPVYGDIIIVNFTLGISVNTPTLNIDGSGANNIRIDTTNVATTTLTTAASSAFIKLWYDGTYWQLDGSHLNTNTTYTVATGTDLDTGTDNAKYATALALKNSKNVPSVVPSTAGNFMKSDGTNWTSATPVKADVGLGNVDNTSDATKKADILATVYPVGSIYTATVSTNPGTLFGFGTWVAYGQGQVLVGKASSGTFSTAGSTGGAETHTLTSSESGIATHTHGVTDPGHNHTINGGGLSAGNVRPAQSGAGYSGSQTNVNSNTTGITIDNVDGASASSAHNNLQPYIVVYIWNRTA